jgi:hypothetical protein
MLSVVRNAYVECIALHCDAMKYTELYDQCLF